MREQPVMTGVSLRTSAGPKNAAEHIRQSAAFEPLSVQPPLGAGECGWPK
jgi:hypothetical protein